jgi:ariadne-1
VESYVEANTEILRWCPGADCRWIAIKPRLRLFEDDGDDFLCQNCQTALCFRCGHPPHGGPCQEPPVAQVNAVNDARAPNNQKNQAGAAKEKDLNKMIKQCPKCPVDIEKIGGCNRMRCKCGHAFCWLCLGAMSNYSHKCGVQDRRPGDRPGERTRVLANPTVDLDYLQVVVSKWNHGALPLDSQSRMARLKDLDRYAHHYNRCHVHDQGRRFAEAQRPCLDERARNYTDVAGIKIGTDTDFIRSANETLAASRRVLKFSYCIAYHLPDNAGDYASLGLQHHLERLERFTEKLSEISEAAFSCEDRLKCVNLVGVKYYHGKKICHTTNMFSLSFL